MGLILRIILIVAVFLLGVGVLGLLIMSGVAAGHGVERIPIPLHSYAAYGAAGADYSDAYQAPMVYASFRTIEEVAANAFQKGQEIFRTDDEVVYEGEAPGLHYTISYMLARASDPPTITVVTKVYYTTRAGSWYFRVVRPIHRRLIPIMVDRMAQAAASM